MVFSTSRDRQMVLLAPAEVRAPGLFRNVQADNQRRQRLLEDMQRLRGAVYLAEGAIEPWQLDSTGRHIRATDRRAWHLLTVGGNGSVLACARLLPHENTASFWGLELRHSSIAQSERWGRRVRDAVELELSRARGRGINYGELGGWALADDLRGSTEALRIAVSVYALTQMLGGFLCISTATQRNSSASILKRVGGSPLAARGVQIPSYYDPQYRCEMEMLCFDSDRPNPRYTDWVSTFRGVLAETPVVASHQALQPWAADGQREFVPTWRPALER